MSEIKAKCKCGSEQFYMEILPDEKSEYYTEIWKCVECGKIYKASYELVVFRELKEVKE